MSTDLDPSEETEEKTPIKVLVGRFEKELEAHASRLQRLQFIQGLASSSEGEEKAGYEAKATELRRRIRLDGKVLEQLERLFASHKKIISA